MAGTLLTVSLSACSPPPDPPFGPSDLADDWLMMSEGIEFPGGCESDTTIRYSDDGTFSFLDFSGVWRLEKNVLTEIEDNPEIKTGESFRSTLRWNGRDRFWKRYADGSIEEFRRCPKYK